MEKAQTIDCVKQHKPAALKPPKLSSITADMLSNSHKAVELLKLISNKQRLLILCILHEQELSVSDLNKLFPELSQSALSQHLAVLREGNLIANRRESQTIYYSLSSDESIEIIRLLHKLFCQNTCSEADH